VRERDLATQEAATAHYQERAAAHLAAVTHLQERVAAQDADISRLQAQNELLQQRIEATCGSRWRRLGRAALTRLPGLKRVVRRSATPDH
jgi:uncharacterized small protein (DUF1192 family)